MATTSFNSNKENQFGHQGGSGQQTTKGKQLEMTATTTPNNIVQQPQQITMIHKFDPKECPNPTTFSNQRSQNYMSSPSSGCQSLLSTHEKLNTHTPGYQQMQTTYHQNINQNIIISQLPSPNSNAMIISPQHKASTMINPVTLNSNVSEFKNQFMHTTMDHGVKQNLNFDKSYQQQHLLQSNHQASQNQQLLQNNIDTISEEDFQIKVLCVDEVSSIDEDINSMRTPIQLPQTQFQNIFKSKRMSCDSQPQNAKSLLNFSSNHENTKESKVRDYQLKNGFDTLDKGLTQNNWIQSTLACTLQVNTRNNHSSGRNMFSTKAGGPFEMTLTAVSPQSKNAQFHKLENKILLTQIEDGDDCEMDTSRQATHANNHIRQSLNSTLQINNTQLQERLSQLQQRLSNAAGDNPFTTESGLDTHPTSSGVICSCVTSLDGQTNQSCSQCNCQSHQSHSNKQKFMINLEAVLFQEIKLWTMIQSLEVIGPNTLQKLMILCEEWWEVTKDSTCLFDIYKIYRDPHTRKTIRKGLIFESISVVITAFIVQNRQSSQLKSQFKSLKKVLIQAHQNFIHVICYVLHRMGLEHIETNVWAVALKDIIYTKSRINGDVILTMTEDARNVEINSNNEQMLKSFISISKRAKEDGKQLFNSINVVLNEIEKIHINRVKDNLIKALNQQAMLNVQNGPKQTQYQYENQYQNEIQMNNSNNTNDYNLMDQLQQAIQYHYGPADDSYHLPQVVEPFLPKQQIPGCYTLVLDLDETLIHYIESINDPDLMNPIGESQIGTFLIRPGAQEFLREMSQYYELVIFTAGMQDYADWVLDQLDPHRYISYRLYRQHTQSNGQCHIKDLSRTGRDLSKTLIVDNVAENFQMQPENGIFIKTWTDDPSDNALEELAPLLRQIVQKQIPDVREALRIFRIQMTEQIQRGIEKPKLTLE
eukprot:403356654